MYENLKPGDTLKHNTLGNVQVAEFFGLCGTKQVAKLEDDAMWEYDTRPKGLRLVPR